MKKKVEITPLSRTIIFTKELTFEFFEAMPCCVIEEICQIYEINYNSDLLNYKYYRQELFNKIKAYKYTWVMKPYTTHELKLIGKFVNPQVEWIYEKLLEAFNFLKRYIEGYQEVLPDFKAGLQTPSNVYSLNACVLYKVCLQKNLSVNPTDKLIDLENMVRLSILPISYLQRVFLENFFNLTSNQLVNIIRDWSPEKKSKEITHQNLNEAYDFFDNSKNYLSRIIPQNNIEAISLAAINYGANISDAKSPLLEYLYLCKSNLTNDEDLEDYLPMDEVLREKIKDDYNYLLLSKRFDPLFSVKYYNINELKQACLIEGFLEEEIARRDPYELMQISYLTFSFRFGKSRSDLKETPIFNYQIRELKKDEIVGYGTSSEILTAFTYDELDKTFSNYMNFVDPISKNLETFSNNAICKLERYCHRTANSSSNELALKKHNLYLTIQRVKIAIEKEAQKFKDFGHIYSTLPDPEKMQLRKSLQEMMKLAMYMRGWDGENAYPLDDNMPENQAEIDLRVTEAIQNFEQNLKHKDLIFSLPLTKYQGGVFQTEQEKNLGQRYELVKKGIDNDNTDGCIRLSSNFFIGTLWRAMSAIDLDPGFHIEDVMETS